MLISSNGTIKSASEFQHGSSGLHAYAFAAKTMPKTQESNEFLESKIEYQEVAEGYKNHEAQNHQSFINVGVPFPFFVFIQVPQNASPCLLLL
jgi:hypothetical protein